MAPSLSRLSGPPLSPCRALFCSQCPTSAAPGACQTPVLGRRLNAQRPPPALLDPLHHWQQSSATPTRNIKSPLRHETGAGWGLASSSSPFALLTCSTRPQHNSAFRNKASKYTRHVLNLGREVVEAYEDGQDGAVARIVCNAFRSSRARAEGLEGRLYSLQSPRLLSRLQDPKLQPMPWTERYLHTRQLSPKEHDNGYSSSEHHY